MTEFGEWFNQIPPLTKHWFAGSIGIPLLCRLSIFSPYTMVLTTDFLKNLQLWKPLTAVLYYPTELDGFQYLVNLYLLYNYSKRLEIGYFGGRTADYLFMLLFNWIILAGLALAIGMLSLMESMVISVLYVYCMINKDQIVSFWFGTRFKARYLPWAVLAMNLIIGKGFIKDLIGILVGHLYHFVMMKYPADQGVTLLQTPQILYKYFPNTQPAAFVAPNRPRTDPSSTQPTSTPTGYNWGRGRRLED